MDSSPGETAENTIHARKIDHRPGRDSPRIARRLNAGNRAMGHQVPKGRLNLREGAVLKSAVPSGLGCYRNVVPALKRRAIFVRSLRDK
jgi:hypothetical protein